MFFVRFVGEAMGKNTNIQLVHITADQNDKFKVSDIQGVNKSLLL